MLLKQIFKKQEKIEIYKPDFQFGLCTNLCFPDPSLLDYALLFTTFLQTRRPVLCASYLYSSITYISYWI